MKIPLEFRRLQAADLSHWRGEPAGLEEFFQSIDLKIHGVGEAGRDVKPAVPPSVQPRPLIQPGRWARTAWPAVAVIVALAGATSALTLWRSQQSDKPGPTVPAQEQDKSPANPGRAVDAGVVDQPDPNSQSRPSAARDPRRRGSTSPTSHRPPARDPGKVVDGSDSDNRSPAAQALDPAKRPTPAPVPLAAHPSRSSRSRPRQRRNRLPTHARTINPPVAAESPTQFEGDRIWS